jgi:multiple sugar transport system substrate-binding protein
MSVNEASENPGAAWYFIQWALSQENQLAAALEGVPAARASAWADEEFQARAPSSWINASQQSFDVGQPDWNPPVVPVAEVRDAYGRAIVAALNGDNIPQNLERAAQEMDRIISRAQ